MILSARNIPATKLNYVRMLSEISKPELDFPLLQKTIMQDIYFTYSLLNYMNSAFFGQMHISGDNPYGHLLSLVRA